MLRLSFTFLVMLALLTSPLNGLAYSGAPTSFTAVSKTKKEKKSCAPCLTGEGTTALSLPDKLASLGRRTQFQPLLPVQRSGFEGATINFVHTASGQVAFAVTDLELQGAMPIMFQRVYDSARREDSGLGAGWSFILDDRLMLDNERATLKRGDGALLEFRREAGSNRFRLQVNAPGPNQSFELVNEETAIERSAGLTRTYARLGDAYRLSHITDSNDNAVSISFDTRGHIARMESSGGAVLTLDWSEGPDARLLSVADNTGRRVTFKQDGRRLRGATDPAGTLWTYEYEGARLVRALDPLKRTLLRVRYDREARAVQAGDSASTYLYNYDSPAGAASRLTTVTDPLGVKAYFEHSESGLLTAMTDGEGRTMRLEYNAANRPVRISNSVGEETRLSYDAEQRLLSYRSSDGTDKSYAYDEQGRVISVSEAGVRTDYTLNEKGQITAAQSSDATSSYRVSYDTSGRQASLKSERRELSFEYDGRGNQAAFTYSDTGRFSLERDAAGRITRESYPSGLNIYKEYDLRGWLAKQSDNRGRSLRAERDQSGAPIAYVRADNKRLSILRDETGRVIAMTDFNGSTRRFTYDARGAITDYTDSRGRRFKYEYDRMGRLRSVVRADGTRINIERDERGRVRRITPAASARNPNSPRDRRLSHAAPIQEVDMDDPNIDWGDPVVIDTWARHYNSWELMPTNGGLVGGDNSMYQTSQSAGNEVVSPTGMTSQEKYDCAKAILICVSAVGGYITSIGGLIAACAETIGLGCIGAMLLHPVVGPLTIMLCNDAINKCRLNT